MVNILGENLKMQNGSSQVKVAKNNQFGSNASHEGNFECDTCGVSFFDTDTYEKHMQSKQHQKKVAEGKKLANTEEPESDEDQNSSDNDEEETFYCDVCNKTCSGYLSYLTHVKGKGHTKNLRKQKLKKQLGGMPEVLPLTTKDEGTDEDDDVGILPKVYARCNHCQKEFSGPENYKMHLKSVAHLKKTKQAAVLESLKKSKAAKDGDDKKNLDEQDDDDEPFGKCDVCDKSFSGVVPYKIHMQSSVHRKNVQKKDVAQEMKEFFVEAESGYVCKECGKCFPDPVAFKYHLTNNSHEKQKEKKALQEFLDANPEIVITFPFEDDEDKDDEKANSDDDEDADSHSDYYLICKLCHVSMSGPASAKDHVKSKRHLNAKKDKKLLRMLKEKKGNTNKAADGNKVENGKDGDKIVVKKDSVDDKKRNDSGKSRSEDGFEMV